MTRDKLLTEAQPLAGPRSRKPTTEQKTRLGPGGGEERLAAPLLAGDAGSAAAAAAVAAAAAPSRAPSWRLCGRRAPRRGRRGCALTPSSGPRRRRAAVTWALPSAGLRGTASQSGSKSPARSRRRLGHRRAAARGLGSGLPAERRRAGRAPPRPRPQPAPAARVPSRGRRAAASAASGTQGGFWLGGRALLSHSQQRHTPSGVGGRRGEPRTLSSGLRSCWSSDFCNCWHFGDWICFWLCTLLFLLP